MKVDELSEVKDAIRETISEEMLIEGDVYDLPEGANLLKLLDSFGITALISGLEDRYDISVSNDLLLTENLETVDALARMIAEQMAVQLSADSGR